VTRRDLKRLAAHFGIGFNKAKAKFVVKNDEKEKEHGEFKMRRKADEYFGRICRFFDTEKRCCTVYKVRPATCRSFPGGRCGYYDFLSHERRTQEDPDLITLTWNK
jgi:hypothetical protein